MVLERDNHTCQYCGLTPKDGVKLEIDHKIPRSKGGMDIMDNLVTSCFECNRGKRDYLNLTKIKLEDITQEIAYQIFPIIKEKLRYGMNLEIDVAKDKQQMEIFNRNQKRICKFLGIDFNDFYKWFMKLCDMYEEYYRQNYTKLKSNIEHLEVYKKYHNIESDKDVAIRLIEGCCIPNDFIKTINL